MYPQNSLFLTWCHLYLALLLPFRCHLNLTPSIYLSAEHWCHFNLSRLPPSGATFTWHSLFSSFMYPQDFDVTLICPAFTYPQGFGGWTASPLPDTNFPYPLAFHAFCLFIFALVPRFLKKNQKRRPFRRDNSCTLKR